ncbi:unnamed protein product [Amoebophrya sp. A25]|nr:unnamed protein product [Amoebophrya sp. A25]|eukprot:GSA25T00003724001.1
MPVFSKFVRVNSDFKRSDVLDAFKEIGNTVKVCQHMVNDKQPTSSKLGLMGGIEKIEKTLSIVKLAMDDVTQVEWEAMGRRSRLSPARGSPRVGAATAAPVAAAKANPPPPPPAGSNNNNNILGNVLGPAANNGNDPGAGAGNNNEVVFASGKGNNNGKGNAPGGDSLSGSTVIMVNNIPIWQMPGAQAQGQAEDLKESKDGLASTVVPEQRQPAAPRSSSVSTTGLESSMMLSLDSFFGASSAEEPAPKRQCGEQRGLTDESQTGTDNNKKDKEDRFTI